MEDKGAQPQPVVIGEVAEGRTIGPILFHLTLRKF
jgi:hypothetical protein